MWVEGRVEGRTGGWADAGMDGGFNDLRVKPRPHLSRLSSPSSCEVLTGVSSTDFVRPPAVKRLGKVSNCGGKRKVISGACESDVMSAAGETRTDTGVSLPSSSSEFHLTQPMGALLPSSPAVLR